MSRTEQAECRAELLDETANAIKVCAHGKPQNFHWIPRSQIGYLRKDKALAGTTVIFTLPEWLVEEKQCWELVP